MRFLGASQGFGFITPVGDESEEPKEDLFVHQVR
jgi:cold shock CspA family protein